MRRRVPHDTVAKLRRNTDPTDWVLISHPPNGHPCTDLRHEKAIANLLGEAVEFGPWRGVCITDCGCSCALLPAIAGRVCVDCGCLL